MSGIRYTDGYKYQLHETYRIRLPRGLRPPELVVTDYVQLGPDGWLEVKHGYAWDGPSGPTWDSPEAMTPSIVHDALYQLIRLKLLEVSLRDAVDRFFREMCEDRGMWRMRTWLWYQALKRFGGSAATRQSPVLEAP